ncbi:MAG: hypothetical protein AMXMBFR48_23410 [Ignavibacteriales bacterium]
MSEEKKRLQPENRKKWLLWGPYLSERQWGTVREDYSQGGDAWSYCTHDHARSKAYRWGEEGIGGISDYKQRLCFSVALWNGKDPLIKERLFGLAGPEGNHGEDVKEMYYYLDSLPSHAYMKMLYKYPQNRFPYEDLVNTNRMRNRSEREYELMDTGIFDKDEYFDVFIEYAKADTTDMLIRVTAENRAKKTAPVYIIPQIWFRNRWSWGNDDYKPEMQLQNDGDIYIHQRSMGEKHLYYEGEAEPAFCENETNIPRLYGGAREGYFKDGINDYLITGDNDTLNPEHRGTKAGLIYMAEIPAGGKKEFRLRLSSGSQTKPFAKFNAIFSERLKEADEFYEELQHNLKNKDARNIQRQAWAGMLWTKQFYYYDVPQWLKGDPGQPPPPSARVNGRNNTWFNLNNADIISMPDKWEYPWYAAWDLAFHCIPLAVIDPQFAKEQLKLLTREWYMHPNGQLPAYEWNFSDVNPPVHAWAAWRVYKIDQKMNNGKGDTDFLESVLHKMLLNFTWWVNRKDENNRNVFQGGFLGLDNIGVFDRSSDLPTGGHLEQADGTSWMAMFSLNLLRISLELARKNPVYEDIASKFLEHFLYIAGAMTNIGGEGISLWDDDDAFFYDVLHMPDDKVVPLKLRSMVGLIPLFAVEVIEPEIINHAPGFASRMEWFLNYRKDLAGLVSRWSVEGKGERRLFSLLRGHRLKKLLNRMLDETEFLSDYGVRALSKHHEENPYILRAGGATFSVKYIPAESDTGLFGGNSNWRGPVWFPVNFLIIESLQRFHHYFGDEFKIEYPSGSGKMITIQVAAEELSKRLSSIFLKDKNGKRAVYGNCEKLQNDPHFRDYILFYEYFNGDTGEGLGASHQTGWTGLIAKLLQSREHEH